MSETDIGNAVEVCAVVVFGDRLQTTAVIVEAELFSRPDGRPKDGQSHPASELRRRFAAPWFKVDSRAEDSCQTLRTAHAGLGLERDPAIWKRDGKKDGLERKKPGRPRPSEFIH